MSIILNGTTGITTPDVTSDGLTVDSTTLVVDETNNRVGVGTSSPNFPLSFGANIGKTIALFENAGGSVYGIGMGGAGSAGDPYRTKIFSNGSERIAITDAGNVGIGTSSPAQKLHIDGALLFENNKEIRFKDSGATQRTAIAMSSNDLNIGTSAGGNLKFYNGSSYTERARITSSGSLLVGTASTTGNGVTIEGNGFGRIYVGRSNADAVAEFYYQGSRVGSIGITSTNTSYYTSSDYRLKEDWVAVADASTRVNALKPINFAWKVDGSRVDGFLAHELAEVVPEAVTGTKDAMRDEEYEVTPAVLDDEGAVVTPAVMGTRSVPDYQGIDQSKLVPLLTAALQEALAKIEDLTARVVALEGQP